MDKDKIIDWLYIVGGICLAHLTDEETKTITDITHKKIKELKKEIEQQA